MKIWLGNLGKYNEGKLIGKWFELPIDDIEEALKSIGVQEDTQYEEYHICDSEDCPFEVERYSNLNTLNEMAEQIENLNDEQREVLEILLENYDRNFENCLNIVENNEYTIYYDCDDMGDVAREIIQDRHDLKEMGELANYIDYDSYGDTLDTSGTFYAMGKNYVEIHRQ